MSRFLSSPVALTLILAVAAISGAKLFQTASVYYDLKKAEAKLEEKRSRLEIENKAVQEELRLAETPEAIERDAKARLNLKRPDEEVIVVVQNEDAEVVTPSDESPWRHFKDLIRSIIPF